MSNKNENINHIINVSNGHNNVPFSDNEDTLKIKKEREKIEKERRKLEELFEEKIEKTDKKIEKEKKNKKQKKSFFEKLKEKIKFKKKQRNKESKKIKQSKNVEEISKSKKEELEKRKQEKIRVKEERKRLKEEKENQRKELLEKKKLEKEKIDAEKKAKLKEKEDLLLEKQLEKIRAKDEQRRLKEEKHLLDTSAKVKENEKIDISNDEKKRKKQELLEQKRLEKAKKQEEKNKKLKLKYEEQARKKHEKEEKQIALINEKREKEKQINKEKEEARKNRKEKALLIKKAQEESRKKARSERKTFKEKLDYWYNNLSFVKDAKNRKELQRQTLLIDFEGADAVRSEEKIMYKYVAKNKETGKIENGMFAAFSKLDVHSFLLAEGYEVYEITPQKNISKGISLVSTKFKASELDFFLTQLSTFLKSGITLVESVKILSKQSNKNNHKNIYKSIIYELTMGENFSEALSKQGNAFPRLLINMIKTSELTGDLPETLDDMADYYRETEKTKKQMISAITYPAVVLCFAVVILIFIMVSVVPQFVSIYANMESGLPTITVIIINISDFLKSYWLFVVLGIVCFIVVFAILFKSIKVFRSMVQSLIMNFPVFGKIIIYNEVTMFTKTFASLLNHNVYITDCMEVLSKITGNEIYKMLIFDTIANLAKGEAISNSFKNHWAFPNIAYEMILTGERTGQLGEMMDKVAKYYQEQHKNAVNQIKAFIEPVMIITLAAIVGVVLLSVILPMFDMYQNIGV